MMRPSKYGCLPCTIIFCLSLSQGMSSRAGFASVLHNCWALEHEAKGNKARRILQRQGVLIVAVEIAASREGAGKKFLKIVISSTRSCFLSCFLLLPKELFLKFCLVGVYLSQ